MNSFAWRTERNSWPAAAERYVKYARCSAQITDCREITIEVRTCTGREERAKLRESFRSRYDPVTMSLRPPEMGTIESC